MRRDTVVWKQYEQARWLRERGWTVVDTPKHPRTHTRGMLTMRARRFKEV